MSQPVFLSDTVAVAPQITVAEIAELAQLGYKLIINNRPDHEEAGQPTGPEIAEEALRRFGPDAVCLAIDVKLDAAKPQQLVTVPADLVVFVSANRANREIYDALVEKGLKPRIAGDANSPRYLNIAIREGHLAGAAV